METKMDHETKRLNEIAYCRLRAILSETGCRAHGAYMDDKLSTDKINQLADLLAAWITKNEI